MGGVNGIEYNALVEHPRRVWLNSAVGGNCTPSTAKLYIDKGRKVCYHNALAATEDRAMQKCDQSTGYGVRQVYNFGKSDAADGGALLCYVVSPK